MVRTKGSKMSHTTRVVIRDCSFTLYEYRNRLKSLLVHMTVIMKPEPPDWLPSEHCWVIDLTPRRGSVERVRIKVPRHHWGAVTSLVRGTMPPFVFADYLEDHFTHDRLPEVLDLLRQPYRELVK